MRFLLQRSARQALSKKDKVKLPCSETKVSQPVGNQAGPIVDIADVNKRVERNVQWGQQCSPSCGCVVRFQATVDPSSQRYESVGYVARTVVQKGGTSVTTARGRPMLKECQCTTLHHLAAEATHHFQGKTTAQVKNMLEFQSTRSSTAFRKAALATQGLPSTDTRCFDVMEEALTAMVKGYMPASRHEVVTATNDDVDMPRVTVLKGRGYHKWQQQGDDDHSLDFSKFWKDYDAPQLTGPMSTLAMLDYSMSMISGTPETNSETTESKNNSLPDDWQAYVDQLYEEEDDQQSA